MQQHETLTEAASPEPVASPSPLAELGALLIALRKARGLTQQGLAERLGSLQEAVARMEREQYRNTSLERLLKVAEALEARLLVTTSGHDEGQASE